MSSPASRNPHPVPCQAPRDETHEAITAEVVVAGAGIVGLALGIALAQQGIDVVIAGRVDPRSPGRTVALLEGSVEFLVRLGLWPDLAPRAEPLRIMQIVDDSGSLFRVPPVAFRAEEIGQEQFGFNIANADLIEVLAARAHATRGLRLVEARLQKFDLSADAIAAKSQEGSAFCASLLVGVDGRGSPVRQAAGIGAKTWAYPQTAVTAMLRHSRPHKGVSTEFHTRQGPFTLVPLPGSAEATHRSSLVWVTSPGRAEQFSASPGLLGHEAERQSRMLLGRLTVDGPTGSFPIVGLLGDRLTTARVALAGEAAHALPPIGAQGLNLGLRDVADLAETLAGAKRMRADLGATAVLDRYERRRRGDIALRTIGVDRLNRALLSGSPGVDFLRGAGLLALGSFGPLRRLAMRAGLGAPRSTVASA